MVDLTDIARFLDGKLDFDFLNMLDDTRNDGCAAHDAVRKEVEREITDYLRGLISERITHMGNATDVTTDLAVLQILNNIVQTIDNQEYRK